MRIPAILLIVFILINQVSEGDELFDLVQKKAADSSPSGSGKYTYYFNGESLRKVLSIYATSNNLKLDLDNRTSSLSKPVVGNISVSNNTQILEILSNKYNFSWFIYSGKLYISTSEIFTQEINISNEFFPNLKNNLQQIGLLNNKFGYSEIPTENKVIFSGPIKYLDLIKKQVTSLKLAPQNKKYSVFRLKYANAVDTQLTFNNQTITIPGVATILQSLTNSQSGTSLSTGVNEAIKNSSESGTSSAINIQGQPGSKNEQTGLINSDIQADPRTNSVIVLGDNQSIKMYENLITKLDIPTLLVQVDVMVIHLDQGQLDQLGINWSTLLGDSDNKTTVGFNNISKYTKFNPGDIFITNPLKLDLRLDALEHNNLAQVSSKPSLVTENNLPAILSISENVFTPLQYGLQNYGQLLNGMQITPRVIFEKNKKLIQLSIILEDSYNSDDVAAETRLTQTTLNSQAIVEEGQSILLAGHTQDTKVKQVTQVPVLGDIPVLGWLFKSTSTAIQRRTSLFLITPKIIWTPEMYKPEMYKINQKLIIDNRDIDTSNNNSLILPQ